MTTVTIPEAFDFLFTPKRYKGAFGGRGSGKSESVARALLLLGAQRPLRILCAREIQKSLDQSVLALLRNGVGKMGLGSFYTCNKTGITGVNGTEFFFAGLRTNIDSIKSMADIDIVWIEEAQSVSSESLRTLIPTIRKPGSEIWATWNPKSASDPIDVLFRGGGADPNDVICRKVNWCDNPFFPEELNKERLWMQKRDMDMYLHVWEGNYLELSSARVFNNWRVEDFKIPQNARFFYGADWGFSQDPTTLVRSALVGSTLYIDHEAWQIGCEIPDLPKLFDRVPDSRKWPIYADSARPETISYMCGQGFNVKSALKGKGSVEDGVAWLKGLDIVIHPRCKHTIDEFTHYSYKVDSRTEEVLPVLVDAHNHCIDAIRYSTALLRRKTVTLAGPVMLSGLTGASTEFSVR